MFKMDLLHGVRGVLPDACPGESPQLSGDPVVVGPVAGERERRVVAGAQQLFGDFAHEATAAKRLETPRKEDPQGGAVSAQFLRDGRLGGDGGEIGDYPNVVLGSEGAIGLVPVDEVVVHAEPGCGSGKNCGDTYGTTSNA